jgi:hypothetical protein
MMQRVSAGGRLLDAQPKRLFSAWEIAAAASDSQVALVAAAFGGAGAMRFTSDGQPIDAQPLVVATADATSPVIASNGIDFMIAWLHGYSREYRPPDLTDIYAMRLSASGAVGPPIAIATGPADQYSAAIASDGRNYMIVYAEANDDVADVVSKKVLREGTLDGTTATAAGRLIATRSEEPLRPAIAALRNGYVVAWEQSTYPDYAEVRLTTINRAGAPTREAVIVASNDFAGMNPTLVMTRSGSGALFYSQLQSDATYGAAMRLFMSKAGEAPQKRRSARH